MFPFLRYSNNCTLDKKNSYKYTDVEYLWSLGDYMNININEQNHNFRKAISYEENVILSPTYSLHNNNALLNVKGEIFYNENFYLYNGTLTTVLEMFCDSCLDVVKVSLEIHVHEKFSEHVSLDNEEDIILILNKSINLTDVMLSNLYLNIPVKVSCLEICKGLCRECGTNRNHNTCECDTTIIDIRLASLLDIFDNKEV
jgi:uncharacterized protein